MLKPTVKEMRPGGPLDITTLKGNVRCFFLGWIGFWGMWYIDDFFNWVDHVQGVVRNYPAYKDQRFHRFLAIILPGTTMAGSFVMGITIYIKKRNARKSAQGQWYDKETLSREELYGEKAEPEHSSGSPCDRPPD